MPTLFDTYRDYETDQLEMIAEQWGIESEINWRKNALEQIIKLVENNHLFKEIIDSLPDTSHHALFELTAASGRIDLAKFTRKYGQLREMGAANREKERPDRNPLNDCERLYYLGLTGIAFFDDDGETKEYVFIPEPFLGFLRKLDELQPISVSLRTVPSKKVVKSVKNAKTSLLDLLCLRLASIRGDIPKDEVKRILDDASIPFLDAFLTAYQTLGEEKKGLNTQKIKHLLTSPENALASELFLFWYENEKFNDLRLIPALEFDGQWINDPVKPRQKLIELVIQLVNDDWVLLDDFIVWVYENEPDFLRTGGEYEQWFIKQSGHGEYLKGFESWPSVDGALIRFLITGPLNWFGFVEISQTRSAEANIVFRRSPHSDALLKGEEWDSLPETINDMLIHKNGDIFLPHNAEREMRYQIARFGSWIGENASFMKFRVDPKAMRRAKTQNISPSQVRTILKKYGQPPVPKNILQAIDRWEKSPDRIVLAEEVVRRFKDAGALEKIMQTDISQLVKERMNETTIVINRKNIRLFEDKLTEKGFLIDIPAKYNQLTK